MARDKLLPQMEMLTKDPALFENALWTLDTLQELTAVFYRINWTQAALEGWI